MIPHVALLSTQLQGPWKSPCEFYNPRWVLSAKSITYLKSVVGVRISLLPPLPTSFKMRVMIFYQTPFATCWENFQSCNLILSFLIHSFGLEHTLPGQNNFKLLQHFTCNILLPWATFPAHALQTAKEATQAGFICNPNSLRLSFNAWSL